MKQRKSEGMENEANFTANQTSETSVPWGIAEEMILIPRRIEKIKMGQDTHKGGIKKEITLQTQRKKKQRDRVLIERAYSTQGEDLVYT